MSKKGKEVAPAEAERIENELGTSSRVGKAKRNFEIHQGDVHIFIKQGEEVSEAKVPKKYWPNLKTEGVL